MKFLQPSWPPQLGEMQNLKKQTTQRQILETRNFFIQEIRLQTKPWATTKIRKELRGGHSGGPDHIWKRTSSTHPQHQCKHFPATLPMKHKIWTKKWRLFQEMPTQRCLVTSVQTKRSKHRKSNGNGATWRHHSLSIDCDETTGWRANVSCLQQRTSVFRSTDWLTLLSVST